MPSRRPQKIRVELNKHAEERWLQRVGRPPGRLTALITALLIDGLRTGLQVHQGRAILHINTGILDLPGDMIACMDLPDYRGIWRVVTFKPAKEHSEIGCFNAKRS